MRRMCKFFGTTLLLALTACKPPPTDADMLRDMPEAEPSFASEPLPSPNTEGAMWAISQRNEGRIIFGVPGEPAVLSLDCEITASPTIRITRNSSADEGAGALLALVGNGHIGRLNVDATEVGKESFWVGEAPALGEVWEPLTGPRELIVTVPGAGTVNIGPSPIPGLWVEACRMGENLDEAALVEADKSEESETKEDVSAAS
jgi:hypothetical protein